MGWKITKRALPTVYEVMKPGKPKTHLTDTFYKTMCGKPIEDDWTVEVDHLDDCQICKKASTSEARIRRLIR